MSKKIIVANLINFIVSVSFGQQAAIRSASTSTKATVIIDQKALVQAIADDSLSANKNSPKSKVKASVADSGLDSEDIGADSEPSSFATGIEDTGSPGSKKIELNLFVACDRVNSKNHSCEQVIDASVGIGEKVEVSLSKSYANETSEDGNFNGKGPTEIGVKYRYYDKNGWTAAALVSTARDDADRKTDLYRREIPSEGTSVTYIPLILTKKYIDTASGRTYTATINAGYTKSSPGRGSDSYLTGLGLGASIDDKTRFVGALAAEKARSTKETTKSYRVGFVRILGKIGNTYEAAAFSTVGQKFLPTGEKVTTVNFGFNIAPK